MGPGLDRPSNCVHYGAVYFAEGAQINEYMVKKALPNFRRFLTDSDKIAALSSNLAYYVVNPATKGRAGFVN